MKRIGVGGDQAQGVPHVRLLLAVGGHRHRDLETVELGLRQCPEVFVEVAAGLLLLHLGRRPRRLYMLHIERAHVQQLAQPTQQSVRHVLPLGRSRAFATRYFRLCQRRADLNRMSLVAANRQSDATNL
jgi:hypothetical protein